MQLPIDFRHTFFPIKEKYIDEETIELSVWMVFGAYDDGTVAVCDAQGNDVFTHVPPRLAERIVRERNAWVRRLLAALNDWPATVTCVKEFKSNTHPDADYGVVGQTYVVVDATYYTNGEPCYYKLKDLHGSIGEPEWMSAERFWRAS